MSVLVKAMDMPPSCFLCNLSFMSGERLFCSAMKNEEVLRAKIDSNCPLVKLPPHGRLIDADELMEKVEHDTPLSTVFEKTMRIYLKNAPTIIEAEGGEI